jgi:hypothetical protein
VLASQHTHHLGPAHDTTPAAADSDPAALLALLCAAPTSHRTGGCWVTCLLRWREAACCRAASLCLRNSTCRRWGHLIGTHACLGRTFQMRALAAAGRAPWRACCQVNLHASRARPLAFTTGCRSSITWLPKRWCLTWTDVSHGPGAGPIAWDSSPRSRRRLTQPPTHAQLIPLHAITDACSRARVPAAVAAAWRQGWDGMPGRGV